MFAIRVSANLEVSVLGVWSLWALSVVGRNVGGGCLLHLLCRIQYIIYIYIYIY